jgi:ATP synthase protein I
MTPAAAEAAPMPHVLAALHRHAESQIEFFHRFQSVMAVVVALTLFRATTIVRAVFGGVADFSVRSTTFGGNGSMSDRDSESDRRTAADDAALSRRLRDLDRRLDQSREARESVTAPEAAPRPGFGMALRLGADFVAGVVVGAAIGFGFDALLGTSPWGLIVFLLLGFAAGILSVMRTAGLIAKRPGLDDDPASRRLDG